MARPRKSDDELHINEIKLRLMPDQEEELRRLAAIRDVPVAVVARSLLMAAVREQLTHSHAA